jgi:hypothetical protein
MANIYLLDTNIVIKCWKDNPSLLGKIDYRVTNHSIMELANGELGQFFPKVSPKFLELLGHMVTNQGGMDPSHKENRYIYEAEDGQVYYKEGNKVSSVDYDVYWACLQNGFTLVTEDKKLLKSTRSVLGEKRAISYEQLVSDVGKF